MTTQPSKSSTETVSDTSDKSAMTTQPSKSSTETVSPSSKVFHYGIEEVPFQQELKSIIEEIRFAVADVGLSTLPSDELASYFNLQTKEDKRMCIMMSRQGFQVVGNDYDVRDIEDGQCFETVNALLDSISPTYRRLFSEALTKKLQELQKDNESTDEMLAGSTNK
nr:GSK3-beta interaction protein-like isoform X1 [Rhipicephalus microplus]XP_037287085.1 GSK3-beta interaction protein-like isoform X1 [Rhipicephalus microplus]